ncbi:MAG: hypothetical protein ACREOI_34850, partial [bacterium]
MKGKTIISLAATAATLVSIFLYSPVQAQARSTGIGLRGSYWNMNNGPAQIIVTNHGGYNAVDVGNAGGWIYFFSRVDAQTFFEFSLGAVGSVKSETYDGFND